MSTPSQERRQHQRVTYTERVQILSLTGAPAGVGNAHDLSRGGIAFITTTPPPTDYTLVFGKPGTEPPLRVRTTTLRCTLLQEGIYDVVWQFVGPAEME